MSATETMQKAIEELDKAKQAASKRVDDAVEKVRTADTTETD